MKDVKHHMKQTRKIQQSAEPDTATRHVLGGMQQPMGVEEHQLLGQQEAHNVRHNLHNAGELSGHVDAIMDSGKPCEHVGDRWHDQQRIQHQRGHNRFLIGQTDESINRRFELASSCNVRDALSHVPKADWSRILAL